jgi:hypothetical protein
MYVSVLFISGCATNCVWRPYIFYTRSDGQWIEWIENTCSYDVKSVESQGYFFIMNQESKVTRVTLSSPHASCRDVMHFFALFRICELFLPDFTTQVVRGDGGRSKWRLPGRGEVTPRPRKPESAPCCKRRLRCLSTPRMRRWPHVVWWAPFMPNFADQTSLFTGLSTRLLRGQASADGHMPSWL